MKRAPRQVEILVSRFGVENRVSHSHTERTSPCPNLVARSPSTSKVTGLAPLPPAIDEWERALIEPVLARVFDTSRAPTTEPEEARDGKAH